MSASKRQDYGTDDDPDANLRAGRRYGIADWVHASTLVDHKSSRIGTFVVKGKLNHEEVRESCIDRAVYAAKAVQLYDEEAHGPQ